MKRNFHDEDFSSYDLTVMEQAPGPEKLDKPTFDLSLTFTKKNLFQKLDRLTFIAITQGSR